MLGRRSGLILCGGVWGFSGREFGIGDAREKESVERLRGESKRDSSTAQTDNFAGAKLKSKSVGLLRSE
jgi:hypothetical protein